MGGIAALFVMQVQFNTGGVVSTTVTVWLQEAVVPQESLAIQVLVITCGQEPLVTVLIFTKVNVFVDALLQQAFVAVGGSKVHVEPHSTVLLVAQSSVNDPGAGGFTTKRSEHD
jgi:hypothetical protein